MNNERLSQDEIDALLKGSDEETIVDSPNIEDYFSSIEQDALGEIGNISFGSSATALSMLLNQKVEITTPSVSLITFEGIVNEFPQPYVAIQVQYTEGFSGVNLLVIKQSDAAIIADLMLGGDGLAPSEELSDIHLSAVQEAMNQMMGSAATSMSTVFNKRVDISPPMIDLMDLSKGAGTEAIPNVDYLVKVSFKLTIGTLIDSNIMQLLPLPFAKSLVQELMRQTETSYEETTVQEELANEKAMEQTYHTLEDEDLYSPKHKTTDEINQEYPPAKASTSSHVNERDTFLGRGGHMQPVQVQPAVFTDFEPAYRLEEQESSNLNMLLDIPLQVTVELGNTKRSVKEILGLSSGSILELDKLAGEPVDILVNNRLIATGEVVVIDENFGVRVTDIISQSDRLKKLR